MAYASPFSRSSFLESAFPLYFLLPYPPSSRKGKQKEKGADLFFVNLQGKRAFPFFLERVFWRGKSLPPPTRKGSWQKFRRELFFFFGPE